MFYAEWGMHENNNKHETIWENCKGRHVLSSHACFETTIHFMHAFSLLPKGREGCQSEPFSMAPKLFLDNKKIRASEIDLC